jgi:hypothetical protein
MRAIMAHVSDKLHKIGILSYRIDCHFGINPIAILKIWASALLRTYVMYPVLYGGYIPI